MSGNVYLSSQVAVQPRPVDYTLLAKENERRYGTEWGRIGGMLLADRYAERTHFIYELLQNAEDALRKRSGWTGPRSVRFDLSEGCLRVSHFGKPFNEPDVRGICGISESTKDLTAIGRFGIGFKSVYAFSDRPEIHSGVEDFAIDDFVRPVAVAPIQRDPDETVIIIPLQTAVDVPIIAAGLASLGPNALLFLREIDQIEWSVQNGTSGLYLRGQPSGDDGTARQIKVVGQQEGQPEIEEDWLLFSRPMRRAEGDQVGHIELGFRLELDPAGEPRRVHRIARSLLSVFFPTVVETHLGFLLQGPLRTTPSRDAVPQADKWNIRCVQAAGELLADALRWLRSYQMLDVSALNCLPTDQGKFEGGMFAPLYDKVKALLTTESLLPGHRGVHLSAKQALLARGQDLRDLLDDGQLSELFAEGRECGWLTGEITQDRAPELRQYLTRELGIAEVTPDSLPGRLKADFLERQSDAWIERLYVFLGSQSGLKARLVMVSLVRLTDGSHVRPHIEGMPEAFLAGTFESGFPTVRPEVCSTTEARSFLISLGLTVPDRVDDVVRNVLPKYRPHRTSLSQAQYTSDMARIVAAFGTDSKTQRDKLVKDLRETAFVLSVSAVDGRSFLKRPDNSFLPTERLKKLLSGVQGTFIVNDQHACLHGQDVRDLLETCGTTRHLRLSPAPDIGRNARQTLREKAGHGATSGYSDRVSDFTLFGLSEIIAKLGKLDAARRRCQAELLWEELALIEDRRGKGVFTSEYSWTHNGSYRMNFPATFVQVLNEMRWVPGPDGELHPPGLVLFESLGWKSNAFLLSQIGFKPPLIAQLAREAGFEPDALDLLKGLGLTSVAELRSRLNIKEPLTLVPEDSVNTNTDNGVPDAQLSQPAGSLGAASLTGTVSGASDTNSGSSGGPSSQPVRIPGQPGMRHPAPISLLLPHPQPPSSGEPGQIMQQDPGSFAGAGRRVFNSFVGVQLDDRPFDSNGLTHEARMALEKIAITLILAEEPAWQRTPPGNPGYDLVKSDATGAPFEWCEVKAMTGSLNEHPVGISRTQFQFACDKGASAWLYIVERAGTGQANIVRIQDPAGQARTFTFDYGWRAVSASAPSSQTQKDV